MACKGVKPEQFLVVLVFPGENHNYSTKIVKQLLFLWSGTSVLLQSKESDLIEREVEWKICAACTIKMCCSLFSSKCVTVTTKTPSHLPKLLFSRLHLTRVCSSAPITLYRAKTLESRLSLILSRRMLSSISESSLSNLLIEIQFKVGQIKNLQMFENLLRLKYKVAKCCIWTLLAFPFLKRRRWHFS